MLCILVAISLTVVGTPKVPTVGIASGIERIWAASRPCRESGKIAIFFHREFFLFVSRSGAITPQGLGPSDSTEGPNPATKLNEALARRGTRALRHDARVLRARRLPRQPNPPLRGARHGDYTQEQVFQEQVFAASCDFPDRIR